MDSNGVAQKAVTLARRAGLSQTERSRLVDGILGGKSPRVPDDVRSQCKKVDGGLALRVIGRRDEVHPCDVLAFSYPSQALADLFAFLNVECGGHTLLGRAMLDNGLLSVIDLRPDLRRFTDDADLDWEPTDPALPDDWRP
jgi:hypothetical protein